VIYTNTSWRCTEEAGREGTVWITTSSSSSKQGIGKAEGGGEMRPLAHLSGVAGALLEGGVLACCLSLLPADLEAEVVCGCLAGSLRSPRGVLLDRASGCLTFLVCGVVAYRLGGEVGVELLKRALKVGRAVMVVVIGVDWGRLYVQGMVDVVWGDFLHEGGRDVEEVDHAIGDFVHPGEV